MENKLKEIFQNKLENYQSPVDPAAWNAIHSGISGGAVATGGTGFLASIGAKVAAVLIVVSAIVGTVYFVSQKDQKPQIVEQQTINPVENDKSEVSEDSKESSADIVSLKEQKEIINNPISNNTSKKIEDSKKTNIVEEYTELADVPNVNYTEESINTIEKKDEVINNDANVNESVVTKTDSPQEDNVIPTKILNSDFQSVQTDENELYFEFSTPDNSDVTYSWNIEGETYTGANPTHEFEKQGQYDVQLIIEDLNGNVSQKNKTIDAFLSSSWGDLINVFTPNNDSYNSNFNPVPYASNITIQRLLIFNNEGIVVYNSDKTKKYQWDGVLEDGSKAKEGVYFYNVSGIKTDGSKMESKAGTFNLK